MENRILARDKARRFGAEPKLAAWLRLNAKIGQVLTIKQLRKALETPGGRPNTDEHFNRRFRNLRRYGWVVRSSQEEGDLKPNEYRLRKMGAPIWLGKKEYVQAAVSAKQRREVFDRDGNRCLLCGIGSGEPYPDEPSKGARLTIGHFVADSLLGPGNPANLRTECSRCNEPVKEEARRSESALELWPKIRGLSRADKVQLLRWVENGYHERNKIDRLFDQIRVLPAVQRDDIYTRLRLSVRRES